MYQPPHFIEADAAQINAFVAAHPFATLITHGAEGLFVTHLPLIHKVDENAFFGHIARANQHPLKADGNEAMLIFSGPQAYISPNWYPSKAETHKVVPTWNYTVVHAYGRLTFTRDEDFLRQNLTDLTAKFEVAEPQPWSLDDAPEDFIRAQFKGIIGVRFDVSRFEAKMKLSQNRSEADRKGIIAALGKRGGADDLAIAALMQIKP